MSAHRYAHAPGSSHINVAGDSGYIPKDPNDFALGEASHSGPYEYIADYPNHSSATANGPYFSTLGTAGITAMTCLLKTHFPVPIQESDMFGEVRDIEPNLASSYPSH